MVTSATRSNPSLDTISGTLRSFFLHLVPPLKLKVVVVCDGVRIVEDDALAPTKSKKGLLSREAAGKYAEYKVALRACLESLTFMNDEGERSRVRAMIEGDGIKMVESDVWRGFALCLRSAITRHVEPGRMVLVVQHDWTLFGEVPVAEIIEDMEAARMTYVVLPSAYQETIPERLRGNVPTVVAHKAPVPCCFWSIGPGRLQPSAVDPVAGKASVTTTPAPSGDAEGDFSRESAALHCEGFRRGDQGDARGIPLPSAARDSDAAPDSAPAPSPTSATLHYWYVAFPHWHDKPHIVRREDYLAIFTKHRITLFPEDEFGKVIQKLQRKQGTYAPLDPSTGIRMAVYMYAGSEPITDTTGKVPALVKHSDGRKAVRRDGPEAIAWEEQRRAKELEREASDYSDAGSDDHDGAVDPVFEIF